MADIKTLEQDALAALGSVSNLETLEAFRVTWLSKQGQIPAQMKLLATLPPEEKKSFGATINALKDRVTALVDEKKAAFEQAALSEKLAKEKVDISLPIRPESVGGLHPITMATSELISIFGKMGFAVAEGPEIEDEFHNFDALNIPESHPARAMHDTFYVNQPNSKLLLRTHTSPVQIRAMKEKGAPIRIIAPGRTYRSDSDMTHTPMFHQIEGLCIEPNIHMGHLKHCLTEFVTKFFGIPDLRVRFRPSFFPFTEPSAEMDIGCERGKGIITLGKGQDWLEILGCGMVHPKVLAHVGIDATKYQGFAFGIGIERIAMLKYGIGDLRTFFESDVRWLSHYRFSGLDVSNIGQMETK